MQRYLNTLVFLIGVLTLCGPSVPCGASPAQGTDAAVADPDQAELTIPAMEARFTAVQTDAGLDEPTRAKLADVLQQVIAELRKAEGLEAKRAELMRLQMDAPELIRVLQAEQAVPLPEEKPTSAPEAALAQLEQSLADAEASLKSAQDKATKHEQDLRELLDRRKTVPDVLAAANEKLGLVATELSTFSAAEGENPQVTEARRLLLTARRKSLQAELDRYETGVATFGARSDLLKLRQSLASREVTAKAALVTAWQGIVSERRRIEAEKAAQEAERIRREKALSRPRISREAEANAKLAEERTVVTEKLRDATERLAVVKQQIADQKASFDAISNRVKGAGLEEALGLLLRRKRDALPDLRALRRELADREADLSATDIRMLELEDEARQNADGEAPLRRALERLNPDTDAAEIADIKAQLPPLLADRVELNAALAKILEDYFNKLLELVEQERKLTARVTMFSEFIDERILWIRSAAVPRSVDLENAQRSLLFITSGTRWEKIWIEVRQTVMDNPAPAGLYVLALTALLILRPRLRRRIRQHGELASKGTSSTFAPTVATLGLSLLMAVMWPSVLLFLAYQLGAAVNAPAPAKSTSAGLQFAGLTFFAMEFMRQVCRPQGLAEAHFGWSSRGARLFRRHLLWMIALSLPLIIIFEICEWSTREESRTSLGRFAFLARVLITAAFLHVTLRAGGVFQGTTWDSYRGRFHRIRHFWHPLGMVVALIIAILSVVGYHYTAVRLAEQVRASVLLIVFVCVGNAMAARWLLISRRRLALDQLRKRREALAVQAGERSDSSPQLDIPPEPELDVSSVSDQTRNLLRAASASVLAVGLWLAWIPVFPALTVLNDYQLWTQKVSVTESVPGAEGAEEVRTVERRIPVSVGDLLLAIIVVAVTVVATKNVPGLLEITILQRLPLDAGGRYAVTTVTRYALTIVGMVVAFGMIGLGWSQVQWLAAAITVGLGFGLQEIFANFVSGLIILFERPVRIGDVVTVGDVEGKVTRIRIRATTIMDWNRRELLVPNKEFITGKLMNWTLSDSITREVLSVGVAYGSDTELVRRLLIKAAEECPCVLKEPRPSAIFRRFGESTLDFDLRVFIDDRDEWADLTHELHTAVDRKFRDAGIEIAFPQRDLHIRSMPPASASGSAVLNAET